MQDVLLNMSPSRAAEAKVMLLDKGASSLSEALRAAIRCPRGPAVVHSEYRPEPVAFQLTEWLEEVGAAIDHVESAKLRKRGCGESFHTRLRNECLQREGLWRLPQARALIKAWGIDHDDEHLQGSPDYMTPGWVCSTLRGSDRTRRELGASANITNNWSC